MNNKKGFTLVELLAVIAILAILILIVLPNIMSLFNGAKKESFITEVKTIAKTAEQQWINDSMFNTSEIVYSKCSNGCTNPLKLSGREQIDYYIKLNKAGKIIVYQVTDGTYQYEYYGDGLNVQDISNIQQISTLTETEILTIPNVKGDESVPQIVDVPKTKYVVSREKLYLGRTIPEEANARDTASAAKADWASITGTSNDIRPFYIKVELNESNVIEEGYVCFELKNKEYCLRGDVDESELTGKNRKIFLDNAKKIYSAFGSRSSNCEGKNPNSSSFNDSNFNCNGSGLYVNTSDLGRIMVYDDIYFCRIEGSYKCSNL